MLEGPITLNPKTEEEERSKVKAMVTMTEWANTFDAEVKEFGYDSSWLAANAVTNWVQHKKASRGRQRTAQSAAGNKLIGDAAKNSSRVIRKALELV